MFQRTSGYLLLGLVLALLYVAFSWSLFANASAINIFPDNEWFLGPVFSSSSTAIRNFEWPLWMPTVLGGLPLFNSPQISPYYPFYFLFLDIWSTPLESIQSLHRITLLHIAILQINCYVLLRALNISRVSALLGVTFAVFNLTTLEIMKWCHLIASYSWLPLYLAGLFRLLDSKWSASSVFMTIIGFSMMASAMVGQPLVLAGLLTCVLILGRLLSEERLLSSLRTVTATAFLIAIALLLSAPVIFPVVSDLGSMIRWVSPTQAVVGHAPIPFEYFLWDQLFPKEMPYFLISGGARHGIGHPYIGLLPIAFAITALAFRKRHWVILPIALFSIYSFVSAFGANLGMAHLNYLLPVINKIREPSYFLIPLNMSISVLAAFGLDFLIQRSALTGEQREGRSFSRYLLPLTVALMLLVAWLLFHATTVPLALPVLLLLAFVVLGYVLPTKGPRVAQASIGTLLVLSVAMQLHAVIWRSPQVADSDYLRLDLVKLDSALLRIRHLDPEGEFRVIFGDGVNSQIASMLASYHGVRTLNSYVNPLPITQFNELYQHGLRGDKYSKGLGAKYLLCRECSNAETYGYRLLEKVADYSIYFTDDVLPRIYVTSRIIGRAGGLEEYIRIITESDLRLLPLVLPSNAFSEASRKDKQLDCIVQNRSGSVNEFVFVVYCDQSAFLVLNEFYSDVWKASINEAPVMPTRVNGNQIGVELGAGSSVVRLRYQPRSVELSRYLFLAGALGLLMVLLWIRRTGTQPIPFLSQIPR